jgi:hypothetical protein
MTKKTTFEITVAVTLSFILITANSMVVPSAHALTRFFNCTTGVANKSGNLTLDAVNSCFDKKFPSQVRRINQVDNVTNGTDLSSVTTAPHNVGDNNSSLSADANANQSSSNTETNQNNFVSSQDLNRFYDCAQRAALDGDGLGLNEAASCYTQTFANSAVPLSTGNSNP